MPGQLPAHDRRLREPDRTRGRALMVELIESLSHGVPAALSELITLGRTRKQRGDDVLAYFDRPGTSNGPTEATNGRLGRMVLRLAQRRAVLGTRSHTQSPSRVLPVDVRSQQAAGGGESAGRWATLEQ